MRTRESGSALIITLLVLTALTVLGLGSIFLTGAGAEVSIAARTGDQALYVAEAGVNYGVKLGIDDFSRVATNYSETITLQDGAGAVAFPGVGANATAEVALSQSQNALGQSILCGLPGYSDKFGSQRFQVNAIGHGPNGASREVEAHVLMPPREGICPPGNVVVGGYQGSL